jgi:hypothetical protein
MQPCTVCLPAHAASIVRQPTIGPIYTPIQINQPVCMRGTCPGAPTYLEEVYNTRRPGGTYLPRKSEQRRHCSLFTPGKERSHADTLFTRARHSSRVGISFRFRGN